MRVFYVGQLYEGGTCLDRMRALQRLGHEVIGFDLAKYQSKHRLLRSAQWRWNLRPLLGDLNQNIVSQIAAAGHVDCLWVDKGVWVFPETIYQLKRRSVAKAVHFTPDPQLLLHRSKHFIAGIPYYDSLVTTKTFEFDLYRSAGAKHVILSQQSFCPIRYANPEPQPLFAADVGFIGHYEKSYAKQIAAVAELSHIWGNGWQIAALTRQITRRAVRGSGVWGQAYVNALASFKIGLGLLSKYIPEQHTTRSFEIPAAGTFLLAERTAEHTAFFTEGKEAEFFATPEELASKAKFYLANDAAREQIANAGRARCYRSGYDIDAVLARILTEMNL